MNIYANVRMGTKYEAQRQEKPFEVSFYPRGDDYIWEGGIGGQYRTLDLEFFSDAEGERPFSLFPIVNNEIYRMIADRLEVDAAAESEDFGDWWRVALGHLERAVAAAKLGIERSEEARRRFDEEEAREWGE